MTHPIVEGLTEAVTMAKLMRENEELRRERDTYHDAAMRHRDEVQRLLLDVIPSVQAQLAELEAESEALHRANIQLAKSCQKAHEALADSRDTAWNDAIDAAAEVFKWNECDLHPKMRKHVIGLIRDLRR